MNYYTKVLSITGIFLINCAVAAVTVGYGDPPASYINNLKNCKQSYIKTGTSQISEYKINGKLSDGRCSVTLTSYMNINDPQTLKDSVSVLKTFAEAFGAKITDAQAEQEIKNNNTKSVDNCNFTKEQINALVAAYAKHDGTNPEGKVERDADGNIKSFSGSFDTAKMSSYDKLMMNYSAGTCTSTEK